MASPEAQLVSTVARGCRGFPVMALLALATTAAASCPSNLVSEAVCTAELSNHPEICTTDQEFGMVCVGSCCPAEPAPPAVGVTDADAFSDCAGTSNIESDVNCELMNAFNPRMCKDSVESSILCERHCCLNTLSPTASPATSRPTASPSVFVPTPPPVQPPTCDAAM